MQENRQEKSQIKQKILLYLNKKGISEYSFYKDSGITRGILQQNNGISEDNMARFLAYAPDVNPTWLLTGEGEMLKTNRIPTATPTADIPVSYRKNKDFDSIVQEERSRYMRDTRPRIPFDAEAGSLSLATQSANESDCVRLPVIPAFPDYDFTILVKGDSMLPDIKSGDELACRFIRQSSYLKWGEVYVLDTNDGVVVKSIYEGEDDTIICHSFNPRFKDFPVDKQDILRVAQVIGLLRRL